MTTDDEMPWMSSREDRLSTHVEFCGPFQRTYVLCNGFAVPHLTVTDADQPDEVMLVLDDRLAFPVPKSHVDRVVALVADAVAIERGYGCFPRSPEDQFMEKAPPFGSIWHGIEVVSTDDDEEDHDE